MQEVSAMVDEKTIDKAVQILLQAAPAGSEVILFGSYARGDATEERARRTKVERLKQQADRTKRTQPSAQIKTKRL